MKGKQIMRNSKQNHTLTHRQTDTTKPLLHSNRNKLARAVKVDTSANSNQRFSVNFLISLVHIENRTSKKTHIFCETYHARSFGRRRQENIKNKQSQTNTNKRKNSAQQKKKIAKLAQIKCRIWTRMMVWRCMARKKIFLNFR